MHFLSLIAASALAASAAGPDDTGSARDALCALAPGLTVCKDDPGSLDAETAKARLDEEFKNLSPQSQSATLDFVLKTFAFAHLDRRDAAYRALKERALVVAYATPNDASNDKEIRQGDTGKRYFAFETIGFVANAAGDKEIALKLVRERLLLIRNLKDGEYWQQHYADVITGTTKAEVYARTAVDAALYGDLDLSRSIIKEGFGGKKEPDYEYYAKLANAENISGSYPAAEGNARKALKMAPDEFCEKLDAFGSRRIPAHLSLIESLSKQGKDFAPETKQLWRDVTALCTYISGHASNLFRLAQDLAPIDQALAYGYLQKARKIFSVDDGGGDASSKFFYISNACMALGDQQCLLEIAKAQEAEILPTSPYDAGIAADAYLDAKDSASAERLLSANAQIEVDGRMIRLCHSFARQKGVDQFIADSNFPRAREWLEKWLDCAKPNPVNWQTPFGEGGNIWVDFAGAYAELSQAEAKAGDRNSAKRDAEISYLFAIEASRTWNLEYIGFRADNLGRAYGAAYGALTAAER